MKKTLYEKSQKITREKNVSAKNKSYHYRIWEEGDEWSFSKNIEKEPPLWGSTNTW